MGRPRTPTKVLDARGAFKKDPQRKRAGEPEVKSPLGAAPGHFNKAEIAAWQEIVTAAPLSVLTGADRLAVELTARLLAESRENWLDFTAGKLGQLTTLLGRFGMTPSDRAKLSIEKPKDVNPFAELDE